MFENGCSRMCTPPYLSAVSTNFLNSFDSVQNDYIIPWHHPCLNEIQLSNMSWVILDMFSVFETFSHMSFLRYPCAPHPVFFTVY